MTLDEARALFPVLEHIAYLNAGTFGPLARPTADAIAEQVRRDLEHGRSGKPYIDEVIEARRDLRASIAGLLGAAPEHVALTSSTTDGCNIVLAGLGLRPDDEIVTTNAEHFGLAGPVFASGATVRVALVQELTPEEALDAIVAEVTPRTRLLAVSHVLWTNGVVLDVQALKERTRLPVLVDGAQSVGAIDVDVDELDFYTVSCQKWLCAPEPSGALYVREPESLRVALPSFLSQQAIERDGTFVPSDGAARFDTGWVATTALAGLETALAEAPPNRSELGRAASRRCRELLRERGHAVIADGDATLVPFTAPSGNAAADAARLYDARVIVRDLPGTGWLRASCGWWTTDEHLERLVQALPR
jgi:L-cysteine/cystine lyase